jgi:hypothetical protein
VSSTVVDKMEFGSRQKKGGGGILRDKEMQNDYKSLRRKEVGERNRCLDATVAVASKWAVLPWKERPPRHLPPLQSCDLLPFPVQSGDCSRTA